MMTLLWIYLIGALLAAPLSYFYSVSVARKMGIKGSHGSLLKYMVMKPGIPVKIVAYWPLFVVVGVTALMADLSMQALKKVVP